MVNFGSKDCLHLPKKWQNRISSISTKKCLFLYTRTNCQSDELFKAVLIKNKVFLDINNQLQTTHSSGFNFYGSL